MQNVSVRRGESVVDETLYRLISSYIGFDGQTHRDQDPDSEISYVVDLGDAFLMVISCKRESPYGSRTTASLLFEGEFIVRTLPLKKFLGDWTIHWRGNVFEARLRMADPALDEAFRTEELSALPGGHSLQ